VRDHLKTVHFRLRQNFWFIGYMDLNESFTENTCTHALAISAPSGAAARPLRGHNKVLLKSKMAASFVKFQYGRQNIGVLKSKKVLWILE